MEGVAAVGKECVGKGRVMRVGIGKRYRGVAVNAGAVDVGDVTSHVALPRDHAIPLHQVLRAIRFGARLCDERLRRVAS